MSTNYFISGYFPETYWAKNYWPVDRPAIPKLIVPGYWPSRFFARGFFQQDYWAEYGTEISPPIPPAPPDVRPTPGGGGFVSRFGWINSSLEDRLIEDDNEIMELLANILPIIIG